MGRRAVRLVEAAGPAGVLLATLADLARQGQPVPCRTDPAAWFSDDQVERSGAVQACAFCPALRPCRVYSVAAREPVGVWGGVDRTPRGRGRPRQDVNRLVEQFGGHQLVRESP